MRKKKNVLLSLFLLMICIYGNSQSKVFKEVGDEISSEVQLITQDNALVGYLVFTRLEKATEDSFNYKVTIMDENLNDIGTVNFREESLNLQSASFEQDILCLAYLKSNVVGQSFKNKKTYKAAVAGLKNSVVTQFLNLDGKIIKTNRSPVDVTLVGDYYSYYGTSYVGQGYLKQGIQLRNIPQKGFACFYGDEVSNYITTFDLGGNEAWKKKLGREGKAFSLLTSNDDIYLLTQKNEGPAEGGFELSGYSFNEKAYPKYVLKDKKGNSLKVIGFDNDPITGKPYMSGTIINSRARELNTYKDLTRGPYSGVFTINIDGHQKSDIKETFSYWNEHSNNAISERGKFSESDAYSLLQRGYKDYQGNTYFVGSSIIKRTKWGIIGSSVVLAPLIVVSPFLLAMGGTVKCKVTDAMVLKQNANGVLSYENTIPCNNSPFRQARTPLASPFGPQKKFYKVSNLNTKTDYVIVDDVKDIVIYNLTQKKVMRTISHKDGGSRINIYPAKEGHVMVAEYNKKEKYSRLSIESL
jgi:hypothetical protein